MKSTSSAETTSLGISASNEDVGLGSVGRTSLRACSKYEVNRTSYGYGKERETDRQIDIDRERRIDTSTEKGKQTNIV